MKLPREFVLLDTEYTAWEGSMARGWTGLNEFQEVVQIAAITVRATEENLTITNELVLYSTPVQNPMLSDYFIKLTGINQRTLSRHGIAFGEALSLVRSFASCGTTPICTWGVGDERAIRETCRIQGLSFDSFFSDSFIDIRSYFTTRGIDVRGVQSGTIAEMLGGTVEGRAHDAVHDVRSVYSALSIVHRATDPDK